MVRNTPLLSNSIYASVRQQLCGRVWLSGALLSCVDDAVQEACVRFLTLPGAPAWTEPEISAWLSAVAWHCLLDEYRKQQHWVSLTEENAVHAVHAVAQMSMEEDIARHISSDQALHALSADKRDVIERRIMGKTHREIAAELGEPVETIKKRYQRAIASFPEQLKKQGIEIDSRSRR